MNHAHPTPPPTGQEPAASATPIANYLAAAPRPGVSVDGRYLIVPRVVLDQMPPITQLEFTQLLTAMHVLGSRLPWPPAYRVTAVRWESIGDLTEAGLREVGVIAELDLQGQLVYREDRAGRQLTAEDLQHRAPVSCDDPLYRHVDEGWRRHP